MTNQSSNGTFCRAALLASLSHSAPLGWRAIAAVERDSRLAREFVFTDATFSPAGATQYGLPPLHRSANGTHAAPRSDARRFSPAELARQRTFYEGFGNDAKTAGRPPRSANASGLRAASERNWICFYSLDKEQFYRWKPQLYSRTWGRRSAAISLSVRSEERSSARSHRTRRKDSGVSCSGDEESQRVERYFSPRRKSNQSTECVISLRGWEPISCVATSRQRDTGGPQPAALLQ